MSQSAENQSAIIENENNSNIVMESQAAMSGEDFQGGNLQEAVAPAEAGPETPTQDEFEESMDTEEGGSGDLGSGTAPTTGFELLSGAGDASQESTAMKSPTQEVVAQDEAPDQGYVPEATLSPIAASGEPEEEATEEAMDIGEPENLDAEAVEEPKSDLADRLEEGDLDDEPETDDIALIPTDDTPESPDTGRDEVDRSAEDSQGLDQTGEAQELQEGAADEREGQEVIPDPDILETEEGSNIEGAESVQDADGGLQDDEDLGQDQAEEGETGMSAEDEDRLLAEENSQSQTYDEEQLGSGDAPESTVDAEYVEDNAEPTAETAPDTGEDGVEVGEDAAEVLEDEPEMSEGVQDDDQNEPDTVDHEGNMADNVTDYGQSDVQDIEAANEANVPDDEENVADSVSGPEIIGDFPQALDSDEKVRDVVDVEQGTGAQAEDEEAQVEDEPVQAEDEPVQAEEEPIQAEDESIQAEEEPAQTEEEPIQAEGEPVQGDDEEVQAENQQAQSEEEMVQAEDGTVPTEEKASTDQGVDAEGTLGDAVGSETSVKDREAEEGGDVSMEEQTEEATGYQDHDGQDKEEKPMDEASGEISEEAESKPSNQDEQGEGGSCTQVADAENDKTSDATVEELRDEGDESAVQVSDVKSGAESEEKLSAEDKGSEDDTKESPDASEANKTEAVSEPSDLTKSKTKTSADSKVTSVDDDDDVVVLDDDDDTVPAVKKEAVEKELFNTNNEMGIQIESVSGGADELHEQADQHAVKQENGIEQKPAVTPATPVKKEPQPAKKSAAKVQTCIVCKRVGKCKYNIVRNGDIKHLCDDTCFKRFRTNPTMFLKGTTSTSGTPTPPADKKKPTTSKATERASLPPAPPKQTAVPGYKTCVVCQLMNINTQGQFCMWKGLDFCGEGCLGKFQAGISTSCTLCTAFIPQTARSNNCLRLGSEVRPFCSSRCFADYKLRMRLCAYCQKDLAVAPDSFSAPVGSEGSFKDFCSQPCMKKYEDILNTDVEIIRVEGGKTRGVNKCSVCQKSDVIKHSVKYNGVVSNLCSDPCLSAFQYANKLNMTPCDHCNTLCSSLEATPHTVQFEGHQKRFCSDACVTKFRFNHRKSIPCSWCGSQRDNFDMIERLDSNNKYQLFCSLNCLSLYRVNLQAKSNQAVTCDQCLKFVPAQYHLTMSDASVRNFCSYNCVMTFQSQFSKGPPPTPPTPPTPRHKHNTRGRGSKNVQQPPAGSPSFPIISNVVSLAPQGGQQKVNIKNNSGVPVVVSGSSPSTKAGAPVQQQIIIQPPPPKQVKNKSLLCKPFTQTKATSCRPHTQTKDSQTDPIKDKPVLIPVPVPTYVPVPMAMYTAPAPTPVFIPIPIPIPVFIPTTRKSANGILKQIKEIQEKTPADPLEAEILMMAAAVSGDGKDSSDSETDEELLPEIRSKKRHLPADDDDADMMPLASGGKEEEGGEEDMISMALRMAEEMSGPITDLESAVEAVPINTEPPPQPPRMPTPEAIQEEELNLSRSRRGAKRGGGGSRRSGAGRPPKRQRMMAPQPEPLAMHQEPPPPPAPPADADYHLKFTYGVNAWRHWVLFKNAQIERNSKPGGGRIKLFKTDIMQCTADELNFSLCLFVKEVRKPNGEEYSPDSIYYLTLGIQQYLFENGRIDNLFADLYYERFTECLTEILSKCQPKFNASGQMVCRIEEEHLWECKQLGAHSPYVLLNTLIYFHTKYFMLKTPEDHMKLSFAHILKYWKKGQPGKGGQPTRCVSLRYYSVSTAKKDGSAPTSATKKGSKEGIPVYDVTENLDNPLRCPVKLYEFYLSKCPESIKNRSDIFYPVPERSCVPDSPVWYSTTPISLDVMTKMLTRILLVREIQEAHLHAQPIYV